MKETQVHTLNHLYDNHEDARRAVAELSSRGIPSQDISIVANNADNRYAADKASGKVDRDRDGTDDRAEGAATGAGVGAAVGGAAGLLAGLGIMAIPGIGPVVAAGWLASTALGATVGGTAGGLIGALTEAGVSEDEANVYAEGVRRGGTLVSVRIPENRRAEIQAILGGGAVDVGRRAKDYRAAGWQRFDPSSKGRTADEIRRERERFARM
jgi:hypothetical protein